MGAVVVGYVPKPEGEDALERALAEAQLRSEDLVVVNSTSGDALVDASWASDEQLGAVKARVEAAGVAFELVHVVVGREPADHVVEVAQRVREDPPAGPCSGAPPDQPVKGVRGGVGVAQVVGEAHRRHRSPAGSGRARRVRSDGMSRA